MWGIYKTRSAEIKIVADILIDSEESQTGGGFWGHPKRYIDVLQNETADGTLALVPYDNVTLTATDMSVEKVVFDVQITLFHRTKLPLVVRSLSKYLSSTRKKQKRDFITYCINGFNYPWRFIFYSSCSVKNVM